MSSNSSSSQTSSKSKPTSTTSITTTSTTVDSPRMTEAAQILGAHFHLHFDAMSSPSLSDFSSYEWSSEALSDDSFSDLSSETSHTVSPIFFPLSYYNQTQTSVTTMVGSHYGAINSQPTYIPNSLLEAAFPNTEPAPQLKVEATDEKPLGTMEKFPDSKLTDFKHVIYNLLVENHNNRLLGLPDEASTVEPWSVTENGKTRLGFRFIDEANPEKKLAELYSFHIRKARLDTEDQSSIFIQDLYKYYQRSCIELLSKYFEKSGRYTFLYENEPLFVPGSTPREAEKRMKTMKTRARMQKKRKTEE